MDNENGNEARPLSASYQPATQDAGLLVRFVGNTAVIASIQFMGIDSFQLLALGEYLKMKGLQNIAMNEAEVASRLARERITVPGAIPIDPSILRDGPRPR